MDLAASSYTSLQQDKLFIANEFNNFIFDVLKFYSQNKFFIIPNDLIESFSNVLGFFLADAHDFDTPEYQTCLAEIKSNLIVNADKGSHLAELFREHQANLPMELESRRIYNEVELHTAILTLNINLRLGKLLLGSNKELTVKQHTTEVENKVNHFIRQQLYPAFVKTISHHDRLNSADKINFIIHELSTYLGWLSGFYANLLDSTAELFATYTFICIEMAANQKLKH